MGFFDRKKEVPELKVQQDAPIKTDVNQFSSLSSLPELPEFPTMEKNQNLQSLPSLPEGSFSESLNLEAIKSNVSSPQNTNIRRMELPNIGEEYSSSQSSFKPATFQQIKTSDSSIQKEPVFIKIDKFQEATTKFKEVKDKINEIEIAFRDIKELKAREETELKSWETELSRIKEKIGNIDSSLFNRL